MYHFLTGRFNQILAVRSYSHLAVVFREYSKVSEGFLPYSRTLQFNKESSNDAVEARSCIDIVAKFTDEQYTTINQSTAVAACKQFTKTLGLKCPAVD